MSHEKFEHNNRLRQKFRSEIMARDQNCLITRLDKCECDACHIVPSSICSKYNHEFQYDKRNGIFLTKSLHTLFDQFYWTFDIYDVNYEKNQYLCKILLSKNNKDLTINYYKDKSFSIPIECFPFLYVHYQIFVSYHYEPQIDLSSLYREILYEDDVFLYLCQNEIPLDQLLKRQFRQFLVEKKIIKIKHKQDYCVNAVISHTYKSDSNEYLVWWDHLPYSESSWEPYNHLSKKTITTYNDYIKETDDL
jgi:hypothetical protein